MPRQIDGRDDGAVADGLLHDVMEDLLHFELADGLEVGAAAARFGEDVAFLVRQLTDGLGAAGVDAENVNHIVVRGAWRGA